MTEFTQAIAILNRAAANAYARDGDYSVHGWAYSTAATRLFAAECSGEEVTDD